MKPISIYLWLQSWIIPTDSSNSNSWLNLQISQIHFYIFSSKLSYFHASSCYSYFLNREIGGKEAYSFSVFHNINLFFLIFVCRIFQCNWNLYPLMYYHSLESYQQILRTVAISWLSKYSKSISIFCLQDYLISMCHRVTVIFSTDKSEAKRRIRFLHFIILIVARWA